MAFQTISVLSIRQPHADHIIFGDKWCENRTWQTRYRGPLFIHAAQWDGPSDQPTPGRGVVGAIIGRTDLVDVVDLERPDSSLSSLQKMATKHGLSTKTSSMEHVCGPVCFLLTSPKALVHPIPCGAKLNIWSKEVEAKVSTSPSRGLRPSPSAHRACCRPGPRAGWSRFFLAGSDDPGPRADPTWDGLRSNDGRCSSHSVHSTHFHTGLKSSLKES
jgi:activating signal cointegrator 1